MEKSCVTGSERANTAFNAPGRHLAAYFFATASSRLLRSEPMLEAELSGVFDVRAATQGQG
jgi:hypothetical protein